MSTSTRSDSSELFLLILVLGIDEFAGQTVHDGQLTKLSPEEIDLFWLLFFLK